MQFNTDSRLHKYRQHSWINQIPCANTSAGNILVPVVTVGGVVVTVLTVLIVGVVKGVDVSVLTVGTDAVVSVVNTGVLAVVCDSVV